MEKKEFFQYKNITVGSDPEFLIADKSGKLISSIGIILGKKDAPQYLDHLGDGYAIQTDNVLGEFNIPCARSAEEAASYMRVMKNYVEGFLEPLGLHPVYKASGNYGYDQLTCEEAIIFGCCPDFNAWTRQENDKPDPEDFTLRSAGCHFHVGYDNFNDDASLDLIKAMDLFLGVPSVIVDTDELRRNLYGKAGAFRKTGFGCEYRTISAFALSDDKLTEWFFGQIYKAVDYLNNNGTEVLNANSERIQGIINSGDVEGAKSLLAEFGIEPFSAE